MSRAGEIRMFLAGEEYEVRELSAAILLFARSEARALSDDMGYADEDGDIVLAAAVAAESLYVDGRRAFDSAMDAMETMTAAELLEAASVNKITVLQRETAENAASGKVPSVDVISGGTRLSGEGINERYAEDGIRNGKNEETKAAAGEMLEQDVNEARGAKLISELINESTPGRTGLSSAKKIRMAQVRTEMSDAQRGKYAEYSDTADTISRKKRMGQESRVLYEKNAFTQARTPDTRLPDRSMCYVSEFFERDSRRYGGAFERF